MTADLCAWGLLLALMLLLGILLGGCSARPAHVVPTTRYAIPEYLSDTDALCVEVRGGMSCKYVQRVREFIAAMEMD